MDPKLKNLPGTPGMKNQCKETFTFNIGSPDEPVITFRCMREKHEDGKHEHYGVSAKGWDYRVCWDEPKVLKVDLEKAFIGKESMRVQ